MLDDGATYIALSGASSLHSTGRMLAWYDIIWNSLVNVNGLPFVKIHGLADTTPISLRTYPWYSTDSSSWAQSTGKGGTAFFNHEGRKVTLGIRSDGITSKRVRDIQDFHGEEQKRLLEHFESLGLDYHKLTERKSEDHIYRLYLGCMYFRDLLENLRTQTPPTVRGVGLVHGASKVDLPSVLPENGPRIYLASWLSKSFTAVFQAVNYPYILLSYAYLGGVSNNHLRWAYQLMGDVYEGRRSTRSAKPVQTGVRPEQPGAGIPANPGDRQKAGRKNGKVLPGRKGRAGSK